MAKNRKPTRSETRNPWPKGAPKEWHMRTAKERALGRAVYGCESVKDLVLRLKIAYNQYEMP